MERREAQGRTDAKSSICLCFDRVSLAASGHPLNMAVNGVFVTDRVIPAQFIDRIYILKDGSWETVGLMETQACRITGNEGGAFPFSRSPAQKEIEDQITRSNENLRKLGVPDGCRRRPTGAGGDSHHARPRDHL